MTREFLIRTGVVQGSLLGPTLYNVFLDHLITKIKNNFQGARFSSGTKIPVLGYADDLVLCSNDFSEMQKMLDFCSDYANKNSFEFNTKKCKTQIIKKSKNKNPPHTLSLSGKNLENVAWNQFLEPLGITKITKE